MWTVAYFSKKYVAEIKKVTFPGYRALEMWYLAISLSKISKGS
jgi:preprotein translocase subunit SecE